MGLFLMLQPGYAVVSTVQVALEAESLEVASQEA
jgi:hypothetical protein